MRSVSFTVPGRLRGKGRPRAVARGGFVRMYTDEKTQSHEAIVRQCAADMMAGAMLLEGPLTLAIHISLNAPKSWSNKKRTMTQYVTGKPDCDNVIKLIADSCNGVLYKDDSEIAEVRIIRRYNNAEPESVSISVCELADGVYFRRAGVAA